MRSGPPRAVDQSRQFSADPGMVNTSIAVVEGLDEDLDGSVAVEIADGRSGRCAVAVAVVPGVGQRHVVE